MSYLLVGALLIKTEEMDSDVILAAHFLHVADVDSMVVTAGRTKWSDRRHVVPGAPF